MKTFAIIGAGFSGTVAAIEFLNRMSSKAELVIINRSGTMARGLAYGTNSPNHLLNVPAGNMTALADEPDSFLDFCIRQGLEVAAHSFVSRRIYGDYLEELLQNAIAKASPYITTKIITSEVISLSATAPDVIITLSNGEPICAQQIALAFGHFPPATPHELSSIVNTRFYLGDPWKKLPVLHSFNGDILLVGSGLTAVDMVTSLVGSGHTGKIFILSRRGILPKNHRTSKRTIFADKATVRDLLKSPPSTANYLKIVRNNIKDSNRQGIDWRDVVASIRPITGELWHRLSVNERRRFLRHVQSYWDAHRHRVAPETYQLFEQSIEDSNLIPIAGRIQSIETDEKKANISISLRRKKKEEKISVELVINCTGPSSNVKKSTDPLINQLINENLIAPDSLGLGIHVDELFFVKNNEGRSSSWLSYIGPMLKADHWEYTAVPELREAAKKLVLKICGIFEEKKDIKTPPLRQ